MTVGVWTVAVAVVVGLLWSCGVSAGPLAPTQLMVEYKSAPVIDESQPRFFWALGHTDRGQAQSAYEIELSAVSKSGSAAVVWDSGMVNSSMSAQVELPSSVSLTSDTTYSWRVRYWDSYGVVSDWSSSAKFDTALLTSSEWKGSWIGGANQLRKEFSLQKLKVIRARLYICGLGYYVAELNGNRVGQFYTGHFTTFQKSVLYDVYDVTNMLRPGMLNALAVSLGRGWYSWLSVGPLSLRCQLSVTYTGGTSEIVAISDLTWKVTSGPITYDDIYVGEDYDARLETPGWNLPGYNDSDWSSATSVSTPPGSLRVAPNEQVTTLDTYSPVSMNEPVKNVYVFDFGQNVAGFSKLHVCGASGTTITITHSEMLLQDGTLANMYSNSPMVDHLTLNGECIDYQQKFTWHGFQYVQLEGFPGVPSPDDGTLQSIFVHNNVEHIGSIAFDSSILNWIQRAMRISALSNLGDIPTDCPQRERRGWTGDAQLSAETDIFNFNMGSFYTKWIQDIRDEQLYDSPLTGAVADTVPFYNWGATPADPAWGAAYILIVNWMYKYYNDTRIIQRHYDGMRAYTENLRATADIRTGLMSFARYGDWCALLSCYPACLSTTVSSFYYLLELETMASFATLLGYTDDADTFTKVANNVREAWNSNLYNSTAHNYEHGWQTESALSLFLGLVPESDKEAVEKALIDDIVTTNNNHFTVGIVGVKYLFPVLQSMGRMDLAYQLAVGTTMPSWYFWETQGATTLWENWQSTQYVAYGSRNHIMFGGHGAWFYQAFGGINMQEDGIAWDKLKIAPVVEGHDMKFTTASVDTPRGLIETSWDKSMYLCASIPENQQATLQCTSGTITTVDFASFGTPTGSCGNYAINPACHASTSVDVITSLCVGKSSCVIPSNDATFGDPCYGTPKWLDVQLSGCSVLLTLDTTIPVGSSAEISVSKLGYDEVYVKESGQTVWSRDTFIPAVYGVYSAVDNGSEIVFEVGSGTYEFVVSESP
ncbi:Alpha-L-rhamnosidase N-terminal domain protein [Pelomyxa schiedti]|nr:Alpha-L-rhamnosidase N-terminal domain protein [Pelomyxa schiedti]